MQTNWFKKGLYYLIKYNSFRHLDVNLGYVFHTEKIHIDQIFNDLIEFCVRYHEITNAKPICAIIPPTNSLLRDNLHQLGFSDGKFIERVKELSLYSTIGYHGHFYVNDEAKYYNAIHCNSFVKRDLKTQFKRDINWFIESQIDHNQIYAGGWWFFNKDLASLLLSYGFKYDFSFSKARYFYNQFSNLVFNEFKIEAGEVFDLLAKDSDSKIKCIQNFIGMHTTPFPEDFSRNLSKLLDRNKGINPVGVVNSHDYDLDLPNTLKCIKYQKDNNNIKFISFGEIVKSTASKKVELSLM